MPRDDDGGERRRRDDDRRRGASPLLVPLAAADPAGHTHAEVTVRSRLHGLAIVIRGVDPGSVAPPGPAHEVTASALTGPAAADDLLARLRAAAASRAGSLWTAIQTACRRAGLGPASAGDPPVARTG